MKKFGIVLGASLLMLLSSFGADTPPEGVTLVDLTSPDTSGTHVTTSNANGWAKPAKNAFDNGTKHNNDDRSIRNGVPTDWIYTFDSPTIVNAYKLYAPGTGPYQYSQRMPKDWTFEAKNKSDANWIILDSRSNESGWGALESRFFNFKNYMAYDSYRFNVTAHNGGDGYVQIDELEYFNLVMPGEPILDMTGLSRELGVYSVTGNLSNADAVCGALAVDSDGDGTFFSAGETTKDTDFSVTLDLVQLASDKTYQIFAIASNDVAVASNAVGFVYNGSLSLVKVCDAQEYQSVPGEVTVSRASADDYPIVVHYGFTSDNPSAAEGKTWLAPSSVTIPAGAASATLTLMPKADSSINEDVTVTLADAGGDYAGFNPLTVDLVIENVAFPAGYNVWCASEKGAASVAANWSKGRVPNASDAVLFDGYFSNASCVWDCETSDGPSATVASWTQRNGYSGTVEFDTEFPTYASAVFPLFTITGDCLIGSGAWTHRGNYNNYGAATEANTQKLSSKRWCLNVAIGGNLSIASGASIDVTGKGFGHDGTSGKSPCYGGYGFGANLQCNPYGSITEPFDPGMGTRAQGDQNKRRSGTGGGAVKLVVSGDVTVDGSILAIGTIDLNVVRSGGTGGSVWIDANQISGTGTINASACQPNYFSSDQAVGPGSGGRIALYTKSALSIPRANLVCNGSSYQGTSASSKTKIASAGTIFIKDDTMSNGALLLKQQASVATANSAKSAVPLMDNMTLDAIELSGCVVLVVETGKTLTLPNGFVSVTTDSATIGANGISLRGGAISVGSGNQTIGGWMLEPASQFDFPADVTLADGGSIGIIRRNITGTSDASTPPRAVTFSVAGDMSVDATSSINVENAVALVNYGSGTRGGWYGGWTTYYDKAGNSDAARTNTYGSVFSPATCGSSPTRNFYAGGAVTMTVAGELALVGKVTASGPVLDSTADGCAPSSGGAINMTVGSLTGTGTITAIGAAGRYCYAGGGAGGRIAIKLTEAGATVPKTITVNAQGRYGYAYNVACEKIGSAGAVYVETKADGAKGGTIMISNYRDRTISEFTKTLMPTTPIVAYINGDPVSDFRKAALVVTNNAIAEVSVPELKMRSLVIAENSKLDLNGKTLTVGSAKLGGTKLAVGTYKATDAAVSSFVVDSAGTDGQLVIRPRGLQLIVR